MHILGKQKGFTLIEILIAALILAVGLLGIAGLQMGGLKNNVSAMYRTQAVQFANDIIDRIRANPTAAYAATLTAAPSVVTNCASSSANCSAANMASYDVTQWKCMLGNFSTNSACTTLAAADSSTNLTLGLPSGDGSIVLNGSIYTITITWADDKRLDSNNNPILTSFVMDFEI
ncbi:type IV pilus modification protein PilV [Alkalimarinus sediminis]|uniref:Type IV pilus modification protein PilV n=1 Tax=Alkalimarinus sediminis TaxID=1632866 RepID=A0A9E8HJJ4_9ALTE|nr:type IV pilus modification protein PilV [Alkalimarinus sediminis]UZW73891.1 type IV pilus modification protein PilV [Alkalimarinus sediminis]